MAAAFQLLADHMSPITTIITVRKSFLYRQDMNADAASISPAAASQTTPRLAVFPYGNVNLTSQDPKKQSVYLKVHITHVSQLSSIPFYSRSTRFTVTVFFHQPQLPLVLQL